MLKEYICKKTEGKRYYLPSEIQSHNTANDCFVTLFHKVFDLTRYIQQNIHCNIILGEREIKREIKR
jgi:hypothetical protein